MVSVGKKAPSFTLRNNSGTTVKLSDFSGKKVVIFFYPKDNTPGCTKEACSFRDSFGKFKSKKIVVLGISPDGEKSHQGFIDKFNLPFALLSDPDHKIAEKYGAWGKKSMYGREYMGILRSTFIVDEKGKISHVFPKVKVNSHADDILEALAL